MGRNVYIRDLIDFGVYNIRDLIDLEGEAVELLEDMRLEAFNKALIISHIGSLLALKESLWMKWIHVYKLKVLNMETILPIVPNTLDSLEWKTQSGVVKTFSVATVWECIRPIGDEIIGVMLCGFLIAFLVMPSTYGPLCESQPDLHGHILFECVFSSHVWDHLKIYVRLPMMLNSLNSIADHIIPMSKTRSARSVIAKVLFAASSYFIWQERNYRLFKN
ncbi:hypothetical protein Tco_1540749 [Tanacetum coccineum]